MEQTIKVRLRGSVVGLYSMPSLDTPACVGTDEFSYEGNPDGLAGAYAAWCQQPVRAFSGKVTYPERCLSQPDVEVKLDGTPPRQGNISGYVHGNGYGTFDFEELLRIVAVPDSSSYPVRLHAA